MVLATPYYTYRYYFLRLIGSDSGPTRGMGNVNGWVVNGLLLLGVSIAKDCLCYYPAQSAEGRELPDYGSTI